MCPRAGEGGHTHHESQGAAPHPGGGLYPRAAEQGQGEKTTKPGWSWKKIPSPQGPTGSRWGRGRAILGALQGQGAKAWARQPCTAHCQLPSNTCRQSAGRGSAACCQQQADCAAPTCPLSQFVPVASWRGEGQSQAATEGREEAGGQARDFGASLGTGPPPRAPAGEGDTKAHGPGDATGTVLLLRNPLRQWGGRGSVVI